MSMGDVPSHVVAIGTKMCLLEEMWLEEVLGFDDSKSCTPSWTIKLIWVWEDPDSTVLMMISISEVRSSVVSSFSLPSFSLFSSVSFMFLLFLSASRLRVFEDWNKPWMEKMNKALSVISKWFIVIHELATTQIKWQWISYLIYSPECSFLQ